MPKTDYGLLTIGNNSSCRRSLYHYNNNSSYDYTKGVNYTWYFPAYGELGFVTAQVRLTTINVYYLLPLLYLCKYHLGVRAHKGDG